MEPYSIKNTKDLFGIKINNNSNITKVLMLFLPNENGNLRGLPNTKLFLSLFLIKKALMIPSLQFTLYQVYTSTGNVTYWYYYSNSRILRA